MPHPFDHWLRVMHLAYIVALRKKADALVVDFVVLAMNIDFAVQHY